LPQDNLESQTYETFEKDDIKYVTYEEAVYRALLDRVPEEEAESRVTVLMVVGEARCGSPGPRCCCSMSWGTAITKGAHTRGDGQHVHGCAGCLPQALLHSRVRLSLSWMSKLMHSTHLDQQQLNSPVQHLRAALAANARSHLEGPLLFFT
jgi:hypothetical protein